MISFKQFLAEAIVQYHHKTFPEVAKRLESGEKIAPGGLSVFTDPEMASRYTPETSLGTIPDNAETVSGRISHRRLLPDMEWSPEAYKKMFIRIAQGIRDDPNYRVPSLTQVSANPSGVHSFVTPGLTTEIDPATGKKRLTRNWEPEFKVVGDKLQIPRPLKISDFPVEFQDGGKPVEKVDIDDPRVKPVVTAKSTIDPSGRSNRKWAKEWGGHGTSGEVTYKDPFSGEMRQGIFGFKELRDLDVLSTKGEINQMTSDALAREEKAKKEALAKKAAGEPAPRLKFTGYRIRGGQALPDKISPKPVETAATTSVNIPDLSPEYKAAAQGSSSPAAKALGAGAEVASKALDVLSPVEAAATGVAGRLSPAIGSVATMWGLADTVFGKEAQAPMAHDPSMEAMAKEGNVRRMQSMLGRGYNPSGRSARDRQQ